MNTAQQIALSAAVAADQVLVALGAANGFQQIADAMNAPSSPATPLWLQAMPTPSILGAILVGDMPTTAAQLAYLQMLLSVPTVDATSANVRAAFGTIFNGKTSLTNLIAAAQRQATRWEALAAFITTATPANLSSVFGMLVTATDVQAALGKG